MGYKSRVYANTLASLNEARILDDEKLRRLIDAPYADALKILADYGIGDGEADSIDSLISRETSVLITFVRENCANDNIRDILLAEFLFNNAKAAYKNKIASTNIADGYYDGIDVSEIVDGDYSNLPKELYTALVTLDEKRDAGMVSSAEIDGVITKAMFDYLRAASKKSNKALRKYIESEIDLLNLLTLLRCRLLGFDQKVLESNLIAGGSISDDDLTSAIEMSDENFESFIGGTDYSEVFGNPPYDENTLTDIEVRKDNYLYSLTTSGKNNILTDMPFVNYFYKQLEEYKVIKMILICLKNGASGEIKRRLRAIYE